MTDKKPAQNLSEEDKQQALYQMQLMQQEAEKIEQQIIELEKRRIELDVVLMSLDEIKNQKKSDILVPVGSGVFAEGTLKEAKGVLVNVGSNIVVRKDIEDAKKSVKEQIDEIENIKDMLQKELQDFLKGLGDLQPRY
ncbi:prefoldin subunit alpha [archaeon CG10_big_fil_rev_8_21_14_0_10_43_11]|nr:MAG: prefoldin subunit alpha [archaeon CG10_big_fil_rev_8_21_14_0_10_43_11]